MPGSPTPRQEAPQCRARTKRASCDVFVHLKGIAIRRSPLKPSRPWSKTACDLHNAVLSLLGFITASTTAPLYLLKYSVLPACECSAVLLRAAFGPLWKRPFGPRSTACRRNASSSWSLHLSTCKSSSRLHHLPVRRAQGKDHNACSETWRTRAPRVLSVQHQSRQQQSPSYSIKKTRYLARLRRAEYAATRLSVWPAPKSKP